MFQQIRSLQENQLKIRICSGKVKVSRKRIRKTIWIKADIRLSSEGPGIKIPGFNTRGFLLYRQFVRN
jgi:hypothetical protein